MNLYTTSNKMSINDYRASENLTYKNLAERLGMTENKVYRICQSSNCIKLADAHRIVHETKGKVSYEDLLGDC